VLGCCFFEDMRLDQPSTLPGLRTDRPKKASRLFKPLTKELKTFISNQMSHINNNCLSDPHKNVIKVTRVNPKMGKAFVSCSAGPLENINRQFNSLLNAPMVGIARADRVINNHIEQSNDRKRMTRLGKGQSVTVQTEKLHVLHSMATSR